MLATSARRLAADLLESSQRPESFSFEEFVSRVDPLYSFAEHTRRAVSVGQRIADGELDRVIVLQPPGHSKSKTFSQLLSAYYLWRHPDRWVALSSHSQQLAGRNSKASRYYYSSAGGVLDASMRQVREWHTATGGGLWAAGRGGTLTGRHYNLGIADDLIKGEKEARSRLVLENLRDWWGSVFYTRALNPSQIVIVQTQWCDDDLAGSMLAAEEEEIKAGQFGNAEKWHVVYWPAIMPVQSQVRSFPSSCTVEPDWRKPGQALWPEKFPVKRLLQIRKNAREWWEPLYQQNPVPLGGGIIKRELLSDVRPLKSAPTMLRKVTYGDLAVSTKDSADLTVFFTLGLGSDGRYYLYPPYIDQAESPETVVQGLRYAKRFGVQIVGYEDVAYQRSWGQQAQRLIRATREFVGMVVHGVRVDRDKESRARAWVMIATQCGFVLLDDGSGWIDEVVPILVRFPKARYKDHADAIGGCFAMMAQIAGGGLRPMSGGKRNDPMGPR